MPLCTETIKLFTITVKQKDLQENLSWYQTIDLSFKKIKINFKKIFFEFYRVLRGT